MKLRLRLHHKDEHSPWIDEQVAFSLHWTAWTTGLTFDSIAFKTHYSYEILNANAEF